MSIINRLYRSNLTLLTDLYQLTMACGYWKHGLHQRRAIFNLFFRNNPFDGGYTIVAGLETAIEFLKSFKFEQDDLDYLSELKDGEDGPLFNDSFLRFLSDLRIKIDVDAVPEGTVVFPFEPIVKVSGSLLEAQLVETALLNIINFQTLVATKTARIFQASKRIDIMEFGLRRAQGFDGALSASRAAFIGGCSATSNVLAGKFFNIPVKGTHAHSWVMAFSSEYESFLAYAEAMPNNCVLLVDTYDILEGVSNAIRVGLKLENEGKKLRGIRIDSGDLAYFSQKTRQMLDSAGLTETKIVASNDLDEYVLSSLNQQNARLDAVGVGTRLVTAYDQPALGGVYKLSCIENEKGKMENVIKLSAQRIKVNIPGDQNIIRFEENGLFQADMIYDQRDEPGDNVKMVNPMDASQRTSFKSKELETDKLLKPVFKNGECIYKQSLLAEIQDRAKKQIDKLHPGVVRLTNPHIYKVGLEEILFNEREKLMLNYTKNEE